MSLLGNILWLIFGGLIAGVSKPEMPSPYRPSCSLDCRAVSQAHEPRS